MISFDRPSAASSGRRDDDLDGLLWGFFHLEMPHPWPAFEQPRTLKLPAAAQDAQPRSRWPARSRMVLAASVALFLAGQFLLPSYMPSGNNQPPSVPSSPVGDTTADMKYDRKIVLEFDGEDTVIRSEAVPHPLPSPLGGK
jgi:hypothetical protein